MKSLWVSPVLGVVAWMLIAPQASAKWFVGKDLYTVAHQRLLEGNTAASFDTMVQAWQQNPTDEQQANLNDLLELAITEDCGFSLKQRSLPEWLSKVAIRREVIQNLNQVLLRLSITGITREKQLSVTFSRWPNSDFQLPNPTISESGLFVSESRRLDEPLSAGLYQLTISADNDRRWSSWVILTKPDPKQKIGWKDSKNWRIEREVLPNTTCPSPVLSMSLFDLNDTNWTPIWTQDVDGKLPTSLPAIDVPDGRYWLSVGLVESRWQGDISILDIQRITRPVDYPDF
ncbi:DUF2861 family protein [Photobacterium sp. CCB-ST2H9]|uniref:DUF2861 family protein n=1 Tax=unclassified Photobacterium TaxID=2628852 RepID=UPI0020031DE7|nr:DUF2861 family protein [Photobacterium sp. CCB-ST2H9]UTM60154.1 DUF2861 family protein [Photobacterium sp. CCB-ST2H9]